MLSWQLEHITFTKENSNSHSSSNEVILTTLLPKPSILLERANIKFLYRAESEVI